MRLTPAELAAERTRYHREFLVTIGFVIGMGIVIFGAIVMMAQPFRQRPHKILAHLDLGMHPADGIGVAAALLAVVVALNIALAAQQMPTDPRERMRAASWQVYVFLISALTASATVAVALTCWTSANRGDSVGNAVSLGLITLITVALASALQLKTRFAEEFIADEYVLQCRLATLADALSRFREKHPAPEIGWLGVLLRGAGMAGLFGWTSALVALGIAGIQQRFIGWSNLVWMGVFGTAWEACLFAAARQLSTFRLLLRHTLDRFWSGCLLVMLASFPALCTLLVLLPCSAWFRIAIIGYYTSIWALGLGTFFTGRRSTRLTAGQRALVERVLIRAKDDVLGSLADVRTRSAAARGDQVRNRLRPSGTAGTRPPNLRRRAQPVGRRNRPA